MGRVIKRAQTVTRLMVKRWPAEALTQAQVFGADDPDDDGPDSHLLAWRWINGEGSAPSALGLGQDACVQVRSTRTGLRWLRVAD
jgi:hypothetical protein